MTFSNARSHKFSLIFKKLIVSDYRFILRNVHGNKDASGFLTSVAKTCQTEMEKWKAKLKRISVLS